MLSVFFNFLFYLNIESLNIEAPFPPRPTASLTAFLHFTMSSIFFTFSSFFITILVHSFQLLMNLNEFLA